jgi:hypothetical protein
MLMRSSPPTTEQMLVALCPLKPTNPKPRGAASSSGPLGFGRTPQLRSSFIADDNERCRPNIAGGNFLPGVHISAEGFADVSRSNGRKRKITIYPVFRVLYPNQGDSGRRFGPIDGRSPVYSGCVPGCLAHSAPVSYEYPATIRIDNPATFFSGEQRVLSPRISHKEEDRET